LADRGRAILALSTWRRESFDHSRDAQHCLAAEEAGDDLLARLTKIFRLDGEPALPVPLCALQLVLFLDALNSFSSFSNSKRFVDSLRIIPQRRLRWRIDSLLVILSLSAFAGPEPNKVSLVARIGGSLQFALPLLFVDSFGSNPRFWFAPVAWLLLPSAAGQSFS
jgi:hypothetical protein